MICKVINDLVFCSIYGKYLNCSNLRKRFKKVITNAGLQDRKFHDLRHTFVTRLLELG
ncbi:tyrosine-type recombinase/integrase [Clostridium autoethanogenum]|uniref:Tyrosine-type recombinase/integrase n=2 Tax=Clostridium TaxID=1485 RepID=A0ABY4TSD7_9CLOT|nr:tyrosine-type recombinase/integrase [Clostridium autoethanogenum]URS74481.1 tyrosine-type recombinase/integrase [Clostridium autoethanogenum DSM 10061]